jgi:hypothetical protein
MERFGGDPLAPVINSSTGSNSHRFGEFMQPFATVIHYIIFTINRNAPSIGS